MILPKNKQKVSLFIDLENYYRDTWAIYPHLLKILTKITSNKVKFNWTGILKNLFEYIKQIVSHDTLLAYPYFN